MMVIATCVVRASDLRLRPGPTTAPAIQPASQPTTKPTGLCNPRSGRRISTTVGNCREPDLTRVVLYLGIKPTRPGRPSSRQAATRPWARKNKAFIPSFTVIPVGTDVEFPNWDSFDHNVFSTSKAAPAFDLDRYPKGQSKTRTFEKVGIVQVFCNIHPQMRAIIVVTPNRYFAPAARCRWKV